MRSWALWSLIVLALSACAAEPDRAETTGDPEAPAAEPPARVAGLDGAASDPEPSGAARAASGLRPPAAAARAVVQRLHAMEIEPPGATKTTRPRAAPPPRIPALLPATTAQRSPKAADVTFPSSAEGSFHVEDRESRLAVSVRVEGARPQAAEDVDGYIVYPAAGPGGADLLLRPSFEGTEDYIAFAERPEASEIAYELTLGERVAGLRLVENTLELLDPSGAPRLRMARPYVVSARGTIHGASVALRGCEADTSPRAPWGRAVTAPGSRTCAVRVAWSPDIEYPAALDPGWTTTGGMAAHHVGHTATLLQTGEVLVAGGNANFGSIGSDAELYDPATETRSPTASLDEDRSQHTASLLPNGDVLIAGSSSNISEDSTEIYHPATGTWSAGPPLATGRGSHTATTLPDQRVLLAGGYHSSQGSLASAVLYDPATNTWSPAANMITARSDHTASLLPNGKVLVAGRGYPGYSSSAEVYDPATNTWTSTGSMSVPRGGHVAASLPSGKVLVAGGEQDSFVTLASAEIYDPSTGAWTATGTMAHERLGHVMSLLPNGKVLVAGGGTRYVPWSFPEHPYLSAAELWSPATGQWSAGGNMAFVRYSHSATPLQDGSVLVAGGAYLIQPIPGEPPWVTKPTGTERFGLSPPGGACGATWQCQTGICALDGTCCDTACSGACEACTSAKTGAPDGVCAPIQPGADPDDECLDLGASSCGTDGACDGAGACRFYPAGTSCLAPSCDGGVLGSAVCDGQGACQWSFASCAPYLSCADAASCASSCAEDSQCVFEAHCAAGGTCEADLALGASCASPAQCSSGHCVDGACCESACAGLCEACSADETGGLDGACAPVLSGLDPDDECADDGAPSCQRNGLCSGSGACQLYPAGALCGPAACDDDVAVELTCNGDGACHASLSDCGPYPCFAGICSSECVADVDCSATGFCEEPLCLPKKAHGAACEAARECLSGHCVDGVCCEAECAGQCEACGEPGALGVCVPVSGAPRGERPACPSEAPGAACSQRVCDGIERGACAGYVGTEVVCSPQACEDGVATLPAKCTGYGKCSPSDSLSCGRYACDGDVCGTSCADDEGCAADYVCRAGECVSGAFCDGDHTVLTDQGEAIDCAPYKCEPNGTCKDSCASVADCVAPRVCGVNGQCIPRPTEVFAEAPSACSHSGAPGSPGSGGRAFWVLAALLGIALRRRSLARRPAAHRLAALLCAALGWLGCGPDPESEPPGGPAAPTPSPLAPPLARDVEPRRAPGARSVGTASPSGGRARLTPDPAPPGDLWSATSNMVYPRTTHTATLLGDGRVLVAGGDSGAASITATELRDPATGTWTLTGALLAPRDRPTATLLSDGRVLVTGGNVPFSSTPLKSAEIYDPATGAWSPAANMNVSRSNHTASLLLDGRVLVCGGKALNYSDTAEIYDPIANTWTFAAPMINAKGGHTASILADGRVLVAGGLKPLSTYLSATEIYDPASNTWTPAASMAAKRTGHRADVLGAPDGRVIVTGGLAPGGGLDSVEIYDPAADTWTLQTAMAVQRTGHAMALTAGGQVLVTGGNTVLNDGLRATETFDPASGAWSPAGDMKAGRWNHTLTLLVTGEVLATGGMDETGTVTPTTDLFGLLPLGAACVQTAECASGHCADGRCCESACEGPCQACSAALTGGANGVCAGVKDATDPHGDCPDQGPSSCGFSGACKAGACQRYPSGVACGTKSCANGTLIAGQCDGQGQCQSVPTSCAPNACAGAAACGSSCDADAACAPLAYCDLANHKCEWDQPNGGACSSGGQCQSGFCVDGACCEGACTALCHACSAAMTGVDNGKCAIAIAGEDPHGDCADEGPASCAQDGLCDGAGACRLYASGTACKAPTCSGNTAVTFACDGPGVCVEGDAPCVEYACQQGACPSACAGTDDCVPTAFCDAGACEPKAPSGNNPCSSDEACTTGLCVDGFCCNAPCGGVCEACDVAEHEGVCWPVPGGGQPHGDRPACPTSAPEEPCSAALCDGVDRAFCGGFVGQFVDKEVSCRDPACAEGVEVLRAYCDGKGHCPPVGPENSKACGAFTCGETACRTSCADGEGCAPGYRCEDGDCLPGACDGDHTVRAGDGPARDCAPYKCDPGGACKTRCDSVHDCASPFACDAEGECVPRPDAAGATGCHMAPRSSSGWPAWALALTCALACFRRRRIAASITAIAAALSSGRASADLPPLPPPDTAAPAPPPTATLTAPPEPPPTEAPDPRKAALERFEKGKALYKAGSIAAALAEFLESRRLFATRNATNNAALCLTELGRFDEALDMYEALLKDFPDSPESVRTPAQKEVVRLRGRVGTVDVTGAEVGAAISIDGSARGDYPPIAPLRVPSGSHVVRVYKEGFEPFEGRVDVAGGDTVRVTARLRALVRPGRARVVEQGGKTLDVVVDGSVVGKTPWEGPLAPGQHTVLLRGAGLLGTQPVSLSVELGQIAPLSLAAEDLPALLRVEPTPAGASLAIDSVTVGRGVWEGRLRAGEHKVEVLAEGFLATTERVRLDRGERAILPVSLRRDTSSPMWRKPSKLTLEIGASLPLAPTFGGDIAGACGEGCSRDLGLGGQAALRGGYEFGSGWALGVGAGYLNVSQTVSNRPEVLRPVGLGPRDGAATDHLHLRGFLAGAWAGYTLGELFPLRLRLHAGVLFGSVIDERSFEAAGGAASQSGVVTSATFLHIAPEVRVGFRLGKSIELSAGVEVLALASLTKARWAADLPVDAGADGIGYFASSDIVDPVMVLVSPGLGARYEF